MMKFQCLTSSRCSRVPQISGAPASVFCRLDGDRREILVEGHPVLEAAGHDLGDRGRVGRAAAAAPARLIQRRAINERYYRGMSLVGGPMWFAEGRE